MHIIVPKCVRFLVFKVISLYYFGCDLSESSPHLYCGGLKHNDSVAISSGIFRCPLFILAWK